MDSLPERDLGDPCSGADCPELAAAACEAERYAATCKGNLAEPGGDRFGAAIAGYEAPRETLDRIANRAGLLRVAALSESGAGHFRRNVHERVSGVSSRVPFFNGIDDEVPAGLLEISARRRRSANVRTLRPHELGESVEPLLRERQVSGRPVARFRRSHCRHALRRPRPRGNARPAAGPGGRRPPRDGVRARRRSCTARARVFPCRERRRQGGQVAAFLRQSADRRGTPSRQEAGRVFPSRGGLRAFLSAAEPPGAVSRRDDSRPQAGARRSPTPAATASGETLAFRRMLRAEGNPVRRRITLASRVEDMVNAAARRIAFHRFELRSHAGRRKGELAAEEIRDMEAQSESLGPAARLGEAHRWFRACVSHFVRLPFDVCAFGDCLANSLHAACERAPDGFAGRHLDMLRAGGTLRQLFAPFGLDASDLGFRLQGGGLIDALEEAGGRRMAAGSA